MVVDGMKQENWGMCIDAGYVGGEIGSECWADVVWTDEPGKVYKIWSASTYYKKIEVIERV